VGGAGDVALNLVIMGPPGAGKGTQAERFAREHGIPKISTGDILREAVSGGTPLGSQVKALMDRGELVGDDLIIGIVQDRLSKPDATRGFVLDGFPRTVPQARALDQVLTDRGPLVVVEIQVPDEELVRRVITRRICSTCGRTVSAFNGAPAEDRPVPAQCSSCGGALVSRSDDSEGVVRDRLKVYWRETKPMIAFYHARPTYRAVNGAQAPERVRDALVSAVASAIGKPAAELKSAADLPSESKA
jgi:adenylate kinase